MSWKGAARSEMIGSFATGGGQGGRRKDGL